MYTLNTPVSAVHGIGSTTQDKLAAQNILTVADLLLSVPLRYEDRSDLRSIDALEIGVLVTIRAVVLSHSSFYKNKRLISTAKVADDSGTTTLMWFNNRFVHSALKVDSEYFFSGKVTPSGTIIQATFEAISDDTTHTNRLVPLYTSTLDLKQGTLRRILKHICDQLDEAEPDVLATASAAHNFPLPNLTSALKQLHFPNEIEAVAKARERLAIEELATLITHSHRIREHWKVKNNAVALLPSQDDTAQDSLPFTLTSSQKQSAAELFTDIAAQKPMNRLLVGDVGSGKTIVAGLALERCVHNGLHGCLVAPTQMLAEQHARTLRQFFPSIPLAVITGKGIALWEKESWQVQKPKPSLHVAHLLVGTHAVLNLINSKNLTLPVGLMVYDEQHRFGVDQRSTPQGETTPHILTMTATPIPRSLMLTIFSHLDLSTLTELPKNRVPTKTWVLPEHKRSDSFSWLLTQMNAKDTHRKIGAFLTLIVCPFIDQSKQESLELVASAIKKYEEIQRQVPSNIVVALLHGRQNAAEKNKVLRQLYLQEIDILVSTPVVEVGIDLPQASAIVIEAGERFGLASLHQLRGRVGRAGQQGYCLVFHTTSSQETKRRLKLFEHIHNGNELAEQDLRHRGAGELFGTTQHGFDQLQFANWSNFELIAVAKQIVSELPTGWRSALQGRTQKTPTPVAN